MVDKIVIRNGKYLLSACLVLIGLCGCTRSLISADLTQKDQPYLPPTVAPSPIPTSIPTGHQVETVAPDDTPTVCTDSLSFISDATIPDGTVVLGGSTIDKRWEVKNTGTCNWDQRYTMRLIGGLAMGAQKEQALIPARAGSNAVIQMEFIAPLETGVHRSAWQAYNPMEIQFGDPIFMEITVDNSSP